MIGEDDALVVALALDEELPDPLGTGRGAVPSVLDEEFQYFVRRHPFVRALELGDLVGLLHRLETSLPLVELLADGGRRREVDRRDGLRRQLRRDVLLLRAIHDRRQHAVELLLVLFLDAAPAIDRSSVGRVDGAVLAVPPLEAPERNECIARARLQRHLDLGPEVVRAAHRRARQEHAARRAERHGQHGLRPFRLRALELVRLVQNHGAPRAAARAEAQRVEVAPQDVEGRDHGVDRTVELFDLHVAADDGAFYVNYTLALARDLALDDGGRGRPSSGVAAPARHLFGPLREHGLRAQDQERPVAAVVVHDREARDRLAQAHVVGQQDAAVALERLAYRVALVIIEISDGVRIDGADLRRRYGAAALFEPGDPVAAAATPSCRLAGIGGCRI